MKKNFEQMTVTSSAAGNLLFAGEGFIQWCVNVQGKRYETAKSYVTAIHMAMTSEFDLEMEDPFLNLRDAFRSVRNGDKEAFERLEFEFTSFQGYKELIEKYADTIITEDGEIKDAPTKSWSVAMRMYLKYLRSKIDRLRQLNGLPLIITDDREMFFELPLSKEFRQYLKKHGKGYKPTSIDGICCRLRRLYNLFLRRRLKVDVMPDLEKYINEGHSLNEFLQLVESKIDYDREGGIAPELTAEDFTRGKAAFSLYREFIEDYSLYPEKYKSERYIPKKK